MSENVLARLFEHNNWANLKIIQACSALSDAQLDAQPTSATKGSIRLTLWHLVGSQQGYLRLVTRVEPPFTWQAAPPFAELEESARLSGEGFLALARNEHGQFPTSRVQTRDGYMVEPWVAMVQVINHATEHREQISSMLSAIGLTPPSLDGWAFAEAENAMTPPSK